MKEIFTRKIGRGDNKMVKLKVGRKVGGFDWYYPIMSKKLFHDLRKLELIFTSEELKKDAIKKYGTSVITYWKFNIERMQKLGY